jgi:hypothetical protein
MAAKFEIVLTDGGGSGGGGGGSGGQGGGPGGNTPARTPRPAWALDPATDTSLGNIPNARPAGLFSGGAKQAIGLAGLAGGAAGGVAGAFGRVGSAYMAAGPAGALVQGVDEAGKFIAGAINAVGHGVRTFGGMLSDLAGNNHLGIFTKAVGGAAEMLDKIPIVGQVYAAYLRTAGAVVETFTGVVQAFVDRGAVLSKYSGDVAGARSRSEVREIMGDIREAQMLGADTGRLTDSWSEIQELVREILLPLKGAVLRRLTDAVDKGAHFLAAIAPFVETGVEGLIKLFDLVYGFQLDAVFKMLQAMTDALNWLAWKKDKKDDPKDLLHEFLMGLGGGADPDMPVDPQRADVQQRLNAPAFAGA